MRVLIYEPSHTGHHMADLSRLLPGILGLPVEVVLATSAQCVKSEAFQVMLSPLEDRLRIETRCQPLPEGALAKLGGPLKVAWHQARECASIARQIKPDHIYIMMGDGMWLVMQALWLLGWRPFARGTTVDTYLISGRFVHPGVAGWWPRVKRWLFRRMIRSDLFSGVYLLDELLDRYANDHKRSGCGPVCKLSPLPVIAGPVMTQAEARSRMGLPIDGRLIVHMGVIGSYKGTDRVLDAFARHLECSKSPKDRLLIAGPHHGDILRMLEKEPYASLLRRSCVVSVDRYLDNGELYHYASAGDLMAVGMHHHQGRSSTILWAAAAGRPVVGTTTGCIGYVIEQNRLGWTCDVSDPEAFCACITKALDTPWSKQDAQRVRRYAQFHSVDNYRQVGTTVLRQRLG